MLQVPEPPSTADQQRQQQHHHTDRAVVARRQAFLDRLAQLRSEIDLSEEPAEQLESGV